MKILLILVSGMLILVSGMLMLTAHGLVQAKKALATQDRIQELRQAEWLKQESKLLAKISALQAENNELRRELDGRRK